MAARSLNKVTLLGNLTRDPELRYTPSGTAVCTFGLATNRSWTSADGGEAQEETEFHRVVAWSKLAEICSQLLYKGRKVYCEGRLQTRKWTGQDGQERTTTEIVIEEMIALGAPKGGGFEGGQAGQGGYTSPAAATQATPVEPGPDEAPDEQDEQAPVESKEEKGGSQPKADKSKAETNQEVDVDDIPF